MTNAGDAMNGRIRLLRWFWTLRCVPACESPNVRVYVIHCVERRACVNLGSRDFRILNEPSSHFGKRRLGFQRVNHPGMGTFAGRLGKGRDSRPQRIGQLQRGSGSH
jgi:hypothetical protein